MARFHLYLPIGYADSAPYFFMSTETIADIANALMDVHHMDPTCSLEGFAGALALADQAPG